MGHPANQFDGELAALQHQRQMEELDGPAAVEQVLDTFATWMSEAGLPGMGLFRKALKCGQTPVETLVTQLQSAADEEIHRIWEHLKGKEEEQKAFAERLKSQEAQTAYFAAVLHGLRTSDPKKQARLAMLTVNCVYVGSIETEILDDMMQAAVELKDEDIVLLGSLYRWQAPILSEKGMNPDKWFGDIQSAHKNLVESGVLNSADHLKYRSSYSRLESLGLVQAIPTITNHYGVGYELYALLIEGKRLYERLREIGTK